MGSADWEEGSQAEETLETGGWCLILVSPFLARLWDAFGVTQAECGLWKF